MNSIGFLMISLSPLLTEAQRNGLIGTIIKVFELRNTKECDQNSLLPLFKVSEIDS